MDSTTETELSIPDDVWVALVAAVCTVGLSLVIRFVLGQSTSLLVRLVPIFPYFVYLFVKKNADSGPLSSLWTWVALIVVVTLGILGFVAL